MAAALGLPHDHLDPFFWDRDMRSEVECLPTCHDAAHPQRYPVVCYGDYVMERLDLNYAYRQRT